MEQERLRYLTDRFKENNCTPAELEELNNWFRSVQMGSEDMEQWLTEAGGEEQLAEASFQRFNQKLQSEHNRFNWMPLLRIAAVLLVAFTVGAIFYHKQFKPGEQQMAGHVAIKQKHSSGINKATITLANGEQIVLDSNPDGKLANQNGTQVNKVADGKITYNNAGAANTTKLVYNTLTTPRGGKYALVLADGTEVTLDAASTITYPVAFTGADRVVEVKGQAYFKVVHNEKQPFMVKVKGQLIRDIGTEFNINAYDDEPELSTTLIEGKVSISNKVNSAVLVPGQQAVVAGANPAIMIRKPVLDDVLAWTHDQYTFYNRPMADILRQAARWYDIDVVYQGAIPQKTFGGTISRYKDIRELLENMRITGGIRYKIEGRRVMIMN